MSSFESTNFAIFDSLVRQALYQGQVNKELLEIVPTSLVEAFKRTSRDLGIKVPISFRTTDLIKDASIVMSQTNGRLTVAHFAPILSKGSLVGGELVIHERALLYNARNSEVRRGKQHTPWQSISDVAHEMKHASQWQENPDLVFEDSKLPYVKQKTELDARLYALSDIKRLKPNSLWDRVERAFIVADLTKDIAHFQSASVHA